RTGSATYSPTIARSAFRPGCRYSAGATAAAPRLRRLHEHPTVARGIGRRVEPPERQILELAQDLRAGRPCPLEMGVHVRDLDLHAVEHPRRPEQPRDPLGLL